jgi:hypothetical protein
MTIQQTIEIPVDHRVYFDLPRDIPAGAAQFQITITPFPVADAAPQTEPEEWVNPLLGLCKDSSLTVEKLLEMRREDRLLEDARDERLWGKSGERTN